MEYQSSAPRWDEARTLFEDLYECLLVKAHAWQNRPEGLPSTPEDFAAAATDAVIGCLTAGVHMLRREWGMHPDDPRWDEPGAEPG